MKGGGADLMEFGIIGTSIWQQNMPLLERLTINRDEKDNVLQRLKSDLGFDELIYLSTCNRVEFVYVISGDDRGPRLLHHLIDFFFQGQDRLNFFPNDFYHFTGKEAITHFFRTTSSLESLVVGETQITGQVKQACQEAAESGLAGPILNDLAERALKVAKKVKRETSIGAGSLSMASLAANELRTLLEDIESPLIALVGSDAMREKLARYINGSLKGRLLFVNRTLNKAENYAREFGGNATTLDEFMKNPGPVDAVVSATAATEAVFEADFLTRLSALDKPVICVDLAVPRDFSNDFDRDGQVRLIDIPALKAKAQGTLRRKFVEAGKANQIVRTAVNEFLSNRMEVSLKPIFQNCYKESVQLAEQAFNDLFSRRVTALEPEEQQAILRLVTKLIGHSSFQPARMLSNALVETQGELNFSEPALTHKETA